MDKSPRTNSRRIGGVLGSFSADIKELEALRDAIWKRIDEGTNLNLEDVAAGRDQQPALSKEEVLALHRELDAVNLEIEGLHEMRKNIGENYYRGGKNYSPGGKD